MTQQKLQHLAAAMLVIGFMVEIALFCAAALGSTILGLICSSLLAVTAVAMLAGIRQPHHHHS